MRKKSVYLRFFMPCCGDARFGKQGRCAHTCYFCVAGGPQKCLLGSSPNAYKLKEADKLSEFCNNSYCSVQSRELVNTWTFVFSNGDFKENDDGDKYMESPHCIVVSVEDTYHLSYHGKTISYNYFVEIDTHSSFWLSED